MEYTVTIPTPKLPISIPGPPAIPPLPPLPPIPNLPDISEILALATKPEIPNLKITIKLGPISFTLEAPKIDLDSVIPDIPTPTVPAMPDAPAVPGV